MTFTLLKATALAGLAVTVTALPLPASAQLQITEIMYNPAGNDAVYEWFEVRNTGATPIDLNGYQVETLGDLYRETFSRSISNSLNPTTVIGPGEVAVLYDGFVSNVNTTYNFSDETFRSTWGIPASVPVIGVDFFPILSNTGTTVGLWADNASLVLDSEVTNPEVPADRTINGFANAAASAVYDTAAPWPSSSNGFSIQWNGVGDPNNGANWYRSEVGGAGVRTSNAIIDTSGTNFKNSTNDLGNPGIIPSGPLATGLIISEIMYNPASSEATPAWEFLEIVNNTGAAIDFGATPYVFDDSNSTRVEAANITSGVIPNGGVAVLFDATNNNLADVQAAWTTGFNPNINFIPVENFPALNNGGDGVGIWDSFASYGLETVTANVLSLGNAVSSLVYSDNANGWPDAGGSQSIYLTDLSADQTVGANWALSGNASDFDSYNANGVAADGGLVVYPGGSVGSPGEFSEVVTPDLPGDYNNDNVVDAADYTVWRDGGSPDSTQAGYDLWANNYGATAPGSSVAVPEPAAVLTVFGALACVAGFRRR